MYMMNCQALSGLACPLPTPGAPLKAVATHCFCDTGNLTRCLHGNNLLLMWHTYQGMPPPPPACCPLTLEPLESAVEQQVLPPRECVPQQVMLGAHPHDAVDVLHVPSDVTTTNERGTWCVVNTGGKHRAQEGGVSRCVG